jgi:hypothetical protein
MIIRLILLLVLGVVFSTIEGFGQIRTKEGLNINLYSTGSKKPLKIEKGNDEYFGIEGSRLIDKIVFTGKEDYYTGTELKLNIFNITEDGKRELLLTKDLNGVVLNGKNKSYTLPIVPWIDVTGKYKIIIKSGSSILLDMNYDVLLPFADPD